MSWMDFLKNCQTHDVDEKAWIESIICLYVTWNVHYAHNVHIVMDCAFVLLISDLKRQFQRG